MWMNNGQKLTGTYCTWQGREVQLTQWKPNKDGRSLLVQHGGDRPGPDWNEVYHPGGLGTTPYRYHLRVPAAEVSDVHEIEAIGYVPLIEPGRDDFRAPVRLIAQDEAGRLFAQCFWADHIYWGSLKGDFGFEEYDRYAWVEGWIAGDRVTDIRMERKDRQQAVTPASLAPFLAREPGE